MMVMLDTMVSRVNVIKLFMNSVIKTRLLGMIGNRGVIGAAGFLGQKGFEGEKGMYFHLNP